MSMKLLVITAFSAISAAALKFSALLPLLVFTLLASCAQMSPSIAAQTQIARNDHHAWVKHYENLAKETEVKLQKYKEILAEYEMKPYFYGRQGQDVRSHVSAIIREYEKTLKESQGNADLHRRMAMEQDNQINKVKIYLDRDSLQ